MIERATNLSCSPRYQDWPRLPESAIPLCVVVYILLKEEGVQTSVVISLATYSSMKGSPAVYYIVRQAYRVRISIGDCQLCCVSSLYY